MDHAHLFKIILLGDSGVGKTSFGDRFATGSFSETRDLTIGVDFHSKVVTREGQKIKLQIWDTAGQEQYKSIVRAYFKAVAGVVLMYDAGCRASFDHLPRWLRDFRECSGSPYTPILLLANKIDGERVVTAETGRAFAAANNLLYEEASVRESENVTGSMMRLVDAVYTAFVTKGRHCPGIRSYDHTDALLPRHAALGGGGRASGMFSECCSLS